MSTTCGVWCKSDGYTVQILQLDWILHVYLAGSTIDYCSSVLAGLPQSTIAPLQGKANHVSRITWSHHTSSLLASQWLPIKFRVTYKLCLLMHAVHVGHWPGYIADLVTQTYSVPGRDRLCCAAGNRFELLAIHHKYGERAFSHTAPTA